MVRGCHILEASDSDSTEPTHVAVTPEQGIDLGASIASLRDVPIVDTDPSEDGWGIDNDLGASEDEESAKSVIEAVARAITNYGRRCRAETHTGHGGSCLRRHLCRSATRESAEQPLKLKGSAKVGFS